ncbi:MAG TPA: DinB family protein [Acidimicrobiales bacterium]|nr:DinB family protein [Acidimicrobiales bacterium]
MPDEELDDPRRTAPSFVADERTMLEAWLEFHRVTLLLKCEGLDAAQLATRPVTSSNLSLHGLVRHMADVERNWFTRCLLRLPDTPTIYYDRAVADNDMVPLDDADWEADLDMWQQECRRSRQAATGKALDDTGLRRGVECSLRWIYNHMIEEYARHNGHADLIREMVDGAVGW